MESDAFQYGPWTCIARTQLCHSGRVMLDVLNAETCRVVRAATLSYCEEPLSSDEIIVDIQEDEDLPFVLCDAGVLTEHIRDINVGRWTYPVYRIHPSLLP